MMRFEYKTLLCGTLEGAEKALNELGAEGWRLHSFEPQTSADLFLSTFLIVMDRATVVEVAPAPAPAADDEPIGIRCR